MPDTEKHTAPRRPAGTKLTINQLPEDDRPREKLMRMGAQHLSDAELLAILIGSGSQNETAVELMQRILNDCSEADNHSKNALNTLGKMSLNELLRYHGMGPAKAITVIAACELGRRRQAEQAAQRRQLDTPEAIYDYMLSRLQDEPVEQAWVVLMNHNCRLIKAECLSRGGITETAVDVRLLVKAALLNNATVVALCHNHPSGNARPSGDDDRLTERVKNACSLMRLHLIDHLIITDGDYYSYRDAGRL